MKIALSFPGCHRRGGVERVMVEAANFLAARGHETHAFSSDWGDESLTSEVICHHVPRRTMPDFLTVPAFLRACRNEIKKSNVRPDVLAGFGAAAQPDSVVWMQSVHAAWIEISQRTRQPMQRLKQLVNPFHPVILHLEKRLLGQRRYRKVVALTEQVKQDVMKHYAVPSDDIVVVPNGYCRQEFNPERSARLRPMMRQRLGFKDGDVVVGFVANEVERKGLIPLLRAVAQLRDKRVHVLAVGRLDVNRCAHEMEQLGLSKRVHFTGPTSEVADFFAAADLFALPTTYEAWGLVIVEALASGLPVLTSRLAGAAVAVREGKTGCLLDDPRDSDEIAQKLRAIIDMGVVDRPKIAETVTEYQWSEVLIRYEETLLACAN